MKNGLDNVHSAVEVLQSLLEKGNTPLAQDFKRYRLKLEWVKVTGKTIGENTSPVGFQKGTLWVYVKSAAWMTQLFPVKKALINKVNSFMGEKWIKDLRFTQDLRDVPKEATSKEDQQAVPAPEFPNAGEEPPRDR